MGWQHVSIFFLAQLKLPINKTLTFRTHHYCLTNHITIETDHKEFPPYIIAPYIIILILVGFMPLSTIF